MPLKLEDHLRVARELSCEELDELAELHLQQVIYKGAVPGVTVTLTRENKSDPNRYEIHLSPQFKASESREELVIFIAQLLRIWFIEERDFRVTDEQVEALLEVARHLLSVGDESEFRALLESFL